MIFEMGSNLSEDTYDTSANKSNKKKSNNIKSKIASNKLESKKEHQLVFTYEKRKGKPVTLVGRFNVSETEKKDVLKLLKKKLACGGAIKDEWIELQGDVKAKIITILEEDGWKFRK